MGLFAAPPNENVDLGTSVALPCDVVVDRGENENPAPAGLAVLVLDPNEKDGTEPPEPAVDAVGVDVGLPKLKLGSEVVVDGAAALEPFVAGLKGIALPLRLPPVVEADAVGAEIVEADVVAADAMEADVVLTPSRCPLYCFANDSISPLKSANGSASS